MRLSPPLLLLTLIVAATITGARLYVTHQLKIANATPTLNSTAQQTISALELKIDQLEQEITALNSLLNSGSTLPIDPQLIAFVEKNIQLDFITPAKAVSVEQAILEESIGQRWLSAFGETGMQMRAYAFEKIGLLPPNQNFIGQLIAAEATGARGFYDTSSGEIQLLHDFDPENIHHQADLVRLLALALLDQHSPLPKITTDDAFLARASIHRGRASLLQQHFYTIQARQRGFVSEKTNQEALEIFSSLPHYVRSLTTFPNQQGTSYLSDLLQQDSKKIADTLITPPTTCRSLLPNPPTAQPEPLPDSENIQLATSLGPVAAQAFVSQILESPELPTWLNHFTFDSLVIELKGSKKKPIVTTTWLTHWQDTSSAAAFAAAAKDILEAENPAATVTHSTTTVTISFSDSDIPNQ